MQKRFTLATVLVVAGFVVFSLVGGAGAVPATSAGTLALEAPGAALVPQAGSMFSCEAPTATIHCYTPADIRSDYGVSSVTQEGAGQTIVLVDSYGSPTAAGDLQYFHDTFFPNAPEPELRPGVPER